MKASVALVALSVAQWKCLCANKAKEAPSSPVSGIHSIVQVILLTYSGHLLYDKVKHFWINGGILLKLKMASKSHCLNIPISFPSFKRVTRKVR